MPYALVEISYFKIYFKKLFSSKVNNDENQRRQDQIKVELSRIILRQKELEENNIRFMKHESDLKKELRNLELTDEEYVNLSKRDEDLLTIKDFVSVNGQCCLMSTLKIILIIHLAEIL